MRPQHESTHLGGKGVFSSIIISQLRRPIEFKFSQICYFVHLLRYTKWEDWSLTTTNSVQCLYDGSGSEHPAQLFNLNMPPFITEKEKNINMSEKWFLHESFLTFLRVDCCLRMLWPEMWFVPAFTKLTFLTWHFPVFSTSRHYSAETYSCDFYCTSLDNFANTSALHWQKQYVILP